MSLFFFARLSVLPGWRGAVFDGVVPEWAGIQFDQPVPESISWMKIADFVIVTR